MSDIDIVDRKRSIAQSSLDNRNRQKYSKPREQPLDKGYDNPIQFTQKRVTKTNPPDDA